MKSMEFALSEQCLLFKVFFLFDTSEGMSPSSFQSASELAHSIGSTAAWSDSHNAHILWREVSILGNVSYEFLLLCDAKRELANLANYNGWTFNLNAFLNTCRSTVSKQILDSIMMLIILGFVHSKSFCTYCTLHSYHPRRQHNITEWQHNFLLNECL